jgi:arylsulfatase A-like enzyme
VAAMLCLAVLGACRERPPALSLDLARAAVAAERHEPRQTILFGTPAALPHQAEGLLLPSDAPAGEYFAWGRRQVEVRLDWAAPAPRQAIVDLAPYPGLSGQSATVFLNGVRIARLEVGDARRRHLFRLPPEPQRRENRLRFLFEERSERVDGYGRRLSAAFHSLTIGEASDAVMDALVAEGAPPPLAVVVAQGVPGLVQRGPSALRYAVSLPARAELRFVPGIHAASPKGRTVLRVTLEQPQGVQELWRGSYSPGQTGSEVRLPVSGPAGSLARVGLHVEPEGEAASWATWGAPRLLGDTPALARPGWGPSAAEARSLERLRRDLAGVNVVLIVLDAASAKHFGCYGYARGTTSEIDHIAADGVLFERAYTPAVYTLAAMSSLWTSQYPDEHQNVDMRTASLDRVRSTLADLLFARGVYTAGFVANGVAGPAFSFDRGFAEFHEVYSKQGSRAEGFRPLLPPWFAAHKSRRFFAYIHYREPHAPYDPPAPFNTLFGPDALPRSETRGLNALNAQGKLDEAMLAQVVRLYDGNLAYADREVGVLRRALEAEGVWDRSVIVVTADHGEAMLEHGYIGHNQQLYEESVHIPLILRFPEGKGPRGVRIPGLVDLVDLAPTIADLLVAGSGGAADGSFRGRSLLTLVAGGSGKTVVPLRSSGERPTYGLRDERFKYIHDSATGRAELYDLIADPEERKDLAEADPLRTAFYRQSLHGWLLTLERAASTDQETTLSPEQVENLRALGYLQ